MEIKLPMKKWGSKMVVDWKKINVGDEFIIDNSLTIVIDDNWQEQRKTYKTRRLKVHLKCFDKIIEIGTESLKKLSFIKKLVKMSKIKKEETTYYLPMIYKDGAEKNFLGNFTTATWWEIHNRFADCRSKKDVAKVYGTYMKYLHPDKVNDERYGCKIAMEKLKALRDYERDNVEKRNEKRENKKSKLRNFVKNLFEEE